MKTALSLCLFLAVVLPSIAEDETIFRQEKLLDGKLSIAVPDDFKRMSPNQRKAKYPRGNPPDVVFSDRLGAVNVSVKYTDNPVTAEQLPRVVPYLKKMYGRQFPEAEWLREGVVEINGKSFALIELRSPAQGSTVRNLMVGTDVGGRLLMVTFNATAEKEKKWFPVGEKVIGTIQISE